MMTSTKVQQKGVSSTDKEFLDVRRDDYAPSRSPSPRRKSNESSPTRSEYSDDAVQAADGLVLDAFNTKSGFNVRIINSEGVCLYYVDNSSFTPGKPDVTLHAGSEKTDPVIGACKWSGMYSKSVFVGLGDYENNAGGVAWEEMKCDTRWHVNFRWKLDLPHAPSQTFVWQRAHSADSEDYNRFSTKHFKLVDEKTGDMVAIFNSNRHKSWRKLGKFKIVADYGETWRRMVLLTALALIEMSRRRSRSRRGGGGAGGGS